MKRFFITICAVVASLSLSAQITLKINAFSINAGESKVVTLDLDNPGTEIASFMCDIYFPEGITVEKNKRGTAYNLSFNAEADRTDATYHTLTSGKQDDGAIRIICYPPAGDIFLGNSGAIINIPIVADENIVTGVYELKIDNQELTNDTGIEAYYPAAYTTTVDVSGIPSSITEVAHPMAEYPVYNLYGQKLSEMQSGVNIVNGKKYIIK